MKNLPHDNLWVVGGKPEWYSGKYISINQDKSYYTNARNNLRAICANENISESFILMNDDFFIMKNIEDLPYFYSGDLKDKISYRRKIESDGSVYSTLLNYTYSDLFKNRIKNPLDYELHVPFVFEKNKLSNILSLRGLWRSSYGNIYNVGGEQMSDVKLYADGYPHRNENIDLETTPFLSTEDAVFHEYKRWFQEKFPEPSPYEY